MDGVDCLSGCSFVCNEIPAWSEEHGHYEDKAKAGSEKESAFQRGSNKNQADADE